MQINYRISFYFEENSVEIKDKREKMGEKKKKKNMLPHVFYTNTHHSIEMRLLRHIKRHQGR